MVMAVGLLPLIGCKGPPARLVAGSADTVIVNSLRPVQLPIQVFDGAGHLLPDSGVRYRWTAGLPVSVSPAGVVTCKEAGDATVRASLASVATHLILHCRPVKTVRALRMLNVVTGAPAQDLPFEALAADGQSVTLLTGKVTLEDSTVAAIDGARIRGLRPGSTGVSMRVGDRTAFLEMHVYEQRRTPEGIRPGEHVAVPVRLAGVEMRRWRLAAAPEAYFIEMLPDSDEQSMPQIAIVGASCGPGLSAHSFFCQAQHDAWVTVYHSQNIDSARQLSGTLAVWRQDWH